MSRFTVIWDRDALDGLAEIWLHSTERSAVSVASVAVDRELRDEPGSKGQLIAEGLSRIVIPPLVAVFSVSDADRRVTVHAVRTLPPVDHS